MMERLSAANSRILKLAVPAFIENTLQTCVGFVDAWMISRIGLFAVTAVGTANAILNVYLAVFIAIGIGMSSLISRNIGKKNSYEAGLNATQGVVIAVLISTVFGIVSIVLGEPLLHLMGIESIYLLSAWQFLGIVGGCSVFIAAMTIFGSILRAQGNTKDPMRISFMINIINIITDYCLIFGIGPIPALGVVGTAIGTVVSRVIGSVILYRIIQKSETPLNFRAVFDIHKYKEIIKITMPATLERLAMRLGQVLYFGLIVAIGTNTFAAHSIAGNIESFTYMPAYALATAGATLVGFSVGGNNLKMVKKYALNSVIIGVVSMMILGVFLYLGAPFFAAVFTKDTAVITEIVTALRIDAFFQPSLAISLILAGVLQGMGDTKTPLVSTVLGMWIIRVSGVYMLGIVWKMGIAGVWITIGIDLTIRSVFLLFRFYCNLRKMHNNLSVNESGS